MKRLVDITVALFILLFALPALIAVSIVIVATDGRPVLFVHRRMGRYGREFGCLKFRTMRRDASQALASVLANDPAAREQWLTTRKLRNDPRITRVGHSLRKYSLDELPQLLNVLYGEMSLVGPRPVTRDELTSYYVGASSAAYFSVRPGLTGPWQVAGRSNVDYPERVALDTTYALNLSLRTDMIILLRTVFVVLARQGAV